MGVEGGDRGGVRGGGDHNLVKVRRGELTDGWVHPVLRREHLEEGAGGVWHRGSMGCDEWGANGAAL